MVPCHSEAPRYHVIHTRPRYLVINRLPQYHRLPRYQQVPQYLAIHKSHVTLSFTGPMVPCDSEPPWYHVIQDPHSTSSFRPHGTLSITNRTVHCHFINLTIPYHSQTPRYLVTQTPRYPVIHRRPSILLFTRLQD